MICDPQGCSVACRRLFGPALFAVASLAFGLIPSPVHAVSIITDGHADIGVAYPPLEMEAHVHAGATVDGVVLGADQEFEPDELIFQVAHINAAPLDNSLQFTGAAPGAALWVLPESFIPGVPFVGISSEHLNPLDWVGDLTWKINTYTAPPGGDFSLWTDGLLGPNVAVSTLDGLPDQFQLPVGSHNHFNFGFSQMGLYTVTFQVSGVHLIDGPQTVIATYQFAAVPEPGTLALFAVACVSLILVGRRRRLLN
jgi:surface-anchored protein